MDMDGCEVLYRVPSSKPSKKHKHKQKAQAIE